MRPPFKDSKRSKGIDVFAEELGLCPVVCRECGSRDNTVVDSRSTQRGVIYRKRRCLTCGIFIRTMEVVRDLRIEILQEAMLKLDFVEFQSLSRPQQTVVNEMVSRFVRVNKMLETGECENGDSV